MLSKEDVHDLLTKEDEKGYSGFDPLASDSSDNEDEDIQKIIAREMPRIKFFDKQLSLKPKGFFKVWMTDLDLGTGDKVRRFLH